MSRVRASAGTVMAYERTASGPAVVLVTGVSTTAPRTPLVAEVAKRFTAIDHNRPRRGRGESGDTLPYAVAREIEDIHARSRSRRWCSPASWPGPAYAGPAVRRLGRAGDAIAASVPRAERPALNGRAHVAGAKVLAQVLERWFAGGAAA